MPRWHCATRWWGASLLLLASLVVPAGGEARAGPAHDVPRHSERSVSNGGLSGPDQPEHPQHRGCRQRDPNHRRAYGHRDEVYLKLKIVPAFLLP